MMEKKISVLICCAMAMLFSPAMLYAQEQTVRLGYCEDRTGGTLSPSGDAVGGQKGVAVKLPANLLKKYAGNKINRIDFAIANKVGDFMTVFITKELGGTPLVTQSTRTFDKGWNSVELKKSYEITGNQDLYIGYYYYADSQTAFTPVWLLDYSKGGTEGVNFYGENGKFWTLDTRIVDYDFCVRAYADGGIKPKGDVGVSDLYGNRMVVMDTPQTFSMQLRNYGMENVTSLTVDVKANGETFETKELAGLSLAHNEQMKFEVSNVVFPFEGNNEFAVEVKSVNGIADADASDNMLSTPIYAIKRNAETYVRIPLLEEFTRESDKQCVEAHQLYKHVIDAYDTSSFIWVKHHLGDKFSLAGQEPDYGYFFKKGVPFTPSVMVDRLMFDNMPFDRGPAYLVEDSRVLESFFNEAKNMLTFVQPYIQVDYDKESRNMDVKVDVESSVKEMICETNLKISVYAVEDGVATATQAGGPADYQQYGVIRKVLSEPWGDDISLAKYQLTKNYSLTVDPSWNADNMRIVAFVHNQHPTDYANCMVYNTAQVFVSPAAGIDKAVVESGAGKPVVAYMGNRLWASGDYRVAGVYGIDGQSYSQTGLSDGLYIIKVTDGKHTHNVKLQINNL